MSFESRGSMSIKKLTAKLADSRYSLFSVEDTLSKQLFATSKAEFLTTSRFVLFFSFSSNETSRAYSKDLPVVICFEFILAINLFQRLIRPLNLLIITYLSLKNQTN